MATQKDTKKPVVKKVITTVVTTTTTTETNDAKPAAKPAVVKKAAPKKAPAAKPVVVKKEVSKPVVKKEVKKIPSKDGAVIEKIITTTTTEEVVKAPVAEVKKTPAKKAAPKKPVVKKEVVKTPVTKTPAKKAVKVITTTTTTETKSEAPKVEAKKAPVSKKEVVEAKKTEIKKAPAKKATPKKPVVKKEVEAKVLNEEVTKVVAVKTESTEVKVETPKVETPKQEVKKISTPATKTDTENALNKILELTSQNNKGKELNTEIPSLEVINYTKRFKKFVAAENVSFNVGHGVIHGFIGPNGSGKTTTIKAMIGAYIPTKGKILVNGNKAGSVAANSLIGYIPERASFPAHLNSLQYLVAMGKLSGLKSKDAKYKAVQILETLGLAQHAKRQPSKFSSGMQKKILLAQSLMTNPKILILDEPAANLDPTARKELFDQLIHLREQGKTIIISSHILSELERIIDEVTFVYYGEVIFSGKIEEFNNSDSDIFIKSTDNAGLAAYLKSKGYKVTGDLKTEIEIANIEREKANKLFAELSASKFTIMSFRSNDLQSVYDKLITKAVLEQKGRQAIDGQKAIATLDAKKIQEKQASEKGGK